MLRFPLNKKLILLTTAGILSGTIVKINNNYLVLDGVVHNYMRGVGDNVFIDRKHVVGYVERPPDYSLDINNMENKSTKRCKVISFKEAISDV